MKQLLRRLFLVLIFGSSHLACAKDHFLLTLLANRMQEAERFEEADQKSFKGARTGIGLLIQSGSFEAGLLKASRQYTVVDNGQVVAEEVDRLHVPLSLKFSLTKFLDIGLGGYGSYAVSRKERAIEANAPSRKNTSAQNDEYGALYLLSGHALVKTSEFILDLRYFEPSASKIAEQTNNLMISLGRRFEI